MERLTFRFNHEVGYIDKKGKTILCGEMTIPQIRECMEKLAAYEDSDLSPDGVEELESKWLMQFIKEHKLHKRGGRNEKNNS